MQIPILNGIATDGSPDFRSSYPVNMIPVPKNSGISAGYLRPADGFIQNGEGAGTDRGGINWDGVCYRVIGDELVSVAEDGTIAVLGNVGIGGLVTMDYSFDRLAIASGGSFYYWDGTALTQVTDPDLGTVVSFRWVDGYFMTTDGVNLVITELNNPLAINPLKYGSSEVDPDPIVSILKIRNEIYAINRYTMEVFDNVGGDFFPFSRIEGAQVQKGAVGTFACCVFQDAIAFVGSGRNEPPAVYIAANSSATKVSTREIDTLLLSYTDAELAAVKVESRTDKSHMLLYVHLPDRTVVFDASASSAASEAVWFVLTSSIVGFSQYLARNMVWCYGKWLVSNPAGTQIGYFTDDIGSHWGQKVRWEFGTSIVYNGGMGAIFHMLELVALTGRVDLTADPKVSTSYSIDGETWSQDKVISAGKQGDRLKRLVWLQQGIMRNWRIQRFRGDSSTHVSFVRLEAQLEPLGA